MAELTLYRCTECGKLSVSLGWLHGHIEKHRPLWLSWRTGRQAFLRDRTEVLTVTEYESKPLAEATEGEIHG